MDYGILYPANVEGQFINGYVDSDYGSDKNSRKSTTGCLFTANGAPILWISKRQTCIALSSTESEYIALTHGGKESVWVSRFYSEYGAMTAQGGMCLKTDSQSAMKLAKNPEYHDKTKHIDIRHHSIRSLIKKQQIILEYIPDSSQPADILTKAVTKENFVTKRYIMGIEPMPQESPKRRALSSVVVNPKRPNLMWTLFILFPSLLTMGGASDVHKNGSPVLWRKSSDPVIIGFQAVTMKIKLLSSCDLMPKKLDPVTTDIMNELCKKAYEEIFLSNLERICPRKHELTKKGKRVIFLAIGFLLIVALASAGVRMAGYAISRTYEIETKQDELKRALNDLERKVLTGTEKIEILEKELLKLASKVDHLINEFSLFKEEVVEVQYIISYLTSKFMEGKKILSETGTAWKSSKLTSNLFEYLNFTLPCKEECPIEYGIFHSCSMSEGRDEIVMEFALPTVNRNLTRVEADPFALMTRNKSRTCALKYSGPTLATVSVEEDCVYETHNEKPRNNLELATLSSCKNSSSFQSIDPYFRLDRCRMTAEGDERNFVQVKFYDDEYYIYCAGTHYFIKKRKIECPPNVFTLPLSLTFTLNEVEYKGSILKLIHREREDPFLKNHINWHLNPHLNWSNIAEELGAFWNDEEQAIQEKAKNLKVFEFDENNGWSWTMIISEIFGLMVIIIVMTVAGLYFTKKGSRRVKQPEKEEMQLQKLETGDSHHRIIIE